VPRDRGVGLAVGVGDEVILGHGAGLDAALHDDALPVSRSRLGWLGGVRRL
jgi:hypothetical protein